MTPRKRTRPSEAIPQTHGMRNDGSDLVKVIQATQDRIRRKIDADPLLREQVYGNKDGSMDGLTKDMVKELRRFLNVPKPARAKAKKPRRGKKP